eukprot:IDg23270t1
MVIAVTRQWTIFAPRRNCSSLITRIYASTENWPRKSKVNTSNALLALLSTSDERSGFDFDHSSNMRNYVYVCDETIAGDKDSNHVCSFLFDYVERIVQPRARFLRLYLDSAPYFKSKFIVWWTAEMVIRGRFQRVVMSYVVPGHTKFEPDVLFSQISNRFYRKDVFQTSELLHVVEWNLMMIECVKEHCGSDSLLTGGTLKVKRRVMQDDYVMVSRRKRYSRLAEVRCGRREKCNSKRGHICGA